MQWCEEDRIENVHGFSHCRCRNITLDTGKPSCPRYKEEVKFRKKGLPENQQCLFNSNTGYCELSKLDEINLIKTTKFKDLHLITDKIVTEVGVRLLESLCEKP